MITRRKDLEKEFASKFEPWLTAWQHDTAIYYVVNPFHYTFWTHIWVMWKGQRLFAFKWWLTHPVTLWWRS